MENDSNDESDSRGWVGAFAGVATWLLAITAVIVGVTMLVVVGGVQTLRTEVCALEFGWAKDTRKYGGVLVLEPSARGDGPTPLTFVSVGGALRMLRHQAAAEPSAATHGLPLTPVAPRPAELLECLESLLAEEASAPIVRELAVAAAFDRP